MPAPIPSATADSRDTNNNDTNENENEHRAVVENGNTAAVIGKAHDVEVRAALSFFIDTATDVRQLRMVRKRKASLGRNSRMLRI